MILDSLKNFWNKNKKKILFWFLVLVLWFSIFIMSVSFVKTIVSADELPSYLDDIYIDTGEVNESGNSVYYQTSDSETTFFIRQVASAYVESDYGSEGSIFLVTLQIPQFYRSLYTPSTNLFIYDNNTVFVGMTDIMNYNYSVSTGVLELEFYYEDWGNLDDYIFEYESPRLSPDFVVDLLVSEAFNQGREQGHQDVIDHESTFNLWKVVDSFFNIKITETISLGLVTLILLGLGVLGFAIKIGKG